MATLRNSKKTSKLSVDKGSHKTGRELAFLGLAAATPVIEVLEARLVFDGAFDATVAKKALVFEQPACVDFPLPEPGVDVSSQTTFQDADAVSEKPVVEIQPVQQEKAEIIFIDSRVEDADILTSSFAENAEVHLLIADKDGVEQIAAVLNGRSGIDAIHIISHGRSGTLDLGSAKLTEASIAGRHADEMAIIKAALAEKADILLYGCEFGAGTRGEAAVLALAHATGADIAASNDLTGAADLGGDWVLEESFGSIETRNLGAPEWNGILAPLTISTTALPIVTGAGGVGTTAVWTNAGFVGSTAVDLRATVITFTPGFPGATTPIFGTATDNPFVQLTQQSIVVLRWEIFQAGTNTPATGAPSWTIKDIDGIGGVPDTRESAAPSAFNLQSYTAQNPSNVIVSAAGNTLEASGTQDQSSEPNSAVVFRWSDVQSWEITYRLWINDPLIQARFEHDGDGDFAFTNPVTTNLLTLDLDANNSTASGNNYVRSYVENDPGVSVVDTDIDLVLNAAASNNLGQAQVVLTNAQTGDVLNVGTLPTGITAAVNTSVSGQITVTLSGQANVARVWTQLHQHRIANI
jgi:large repetitive protein